MQRKGSLPALCLQCWCFICSQFPHICGLKWWSSSASAVSVTEGWKYSKVRTGSLLLCPTSLVAGIFSSTSENGSPLHRSFQNIPQGPIAMSLCNFCQTCWKSWVEAAWDKWTEWLWQPTLKPVREINLAPHLQTKKRRVCIIIRPLIAQNSKTQRVLLKDADTGMLYSAPWQSKIWALKTACWMGSLAIQHYIRHLVVAASIYGFHYLKQIKHNKKYLYYYHHPPPGSCNTILPNKGASHILLRVRATRLKSIAL